VEYAPCLANERTCFTWRLPPNGPQPPHEKRPSAICL
jgi:hypothetical protein